MRMEFYNRPHDNTVQMRGTRYFRSTHNLIAWHKYSDFGRRHKRSGKRETVLENLSAEQIAANTTRGTTPGLVNISLGNTGGFVPFPTLIKGQGEAQRPKKPRPLPKFTDDGQLRKVIRPRELLPKLAPVNLVQRGGLEGGKDYTSDNSHHASLFSEGQTPNVEGSDSNKRKRLSPDSNDVINVEDEEPPRKKQSPSNALVTPFAQMVCPSNILVAPIAPMVSSSNTLVAPIAQMVSSAKDPDNLTAPVTQIATPQLSEFYSDIETPSQVLAMLPGFDLENYFDFDAYLNFDPSSSANTHSSSQYP